MKKKYILMFLSIFFLTGCTATYELDINENIMKEKIMINNMDLDFDMKEIYITNAMPVDYNLTCYLDYDRLVGPNEVKKEKNINYYNIYGTTNGLKADATMDIDSYKDSRLVNMAFASLNINNYDHYISIYGFDGVDIFNQYQTLDSFQVKITTDKEVSEHDADHVDGNTYVWRFTRDDEDKTLYIEMDSSKITKEKQEKRKEYNLNMTAFIIFGTIGIIVALFILYVVLKRKRVNRI